MSRISYRCLPEERSIPVNNKTFWKVCRGNSEIGYIRAVPDTKLISPSLRIWEPVVFESEFDPLEFPHSDSAKDMVEPYVCTNDDPELDHQLELHSNSLMSLNEARLWMRTITRSD